MTEICLSKAYAIIDKERGYHLKWRAKAPKDGELYKAFNQTLRCLNRLKKEFANLSNSDQIPLGL